MLMFAVLIALALASSAFAGFTNACIFKCDESTTQPIVTQHWNYNTSTLWLTQAKGGACLNVEVCFCVHDCWKL